jgi:hypothetical protein
VGTFAPAFPNLDDAIEFSNAMRLISENIAVAEPIPLIATSSPVAEKKWDWVEH